MKTTFVNNINNLNLKLYRVRPNLTKVIELATLLIDEANGSCEDWLEIEVSKMTYLVDVKLLKKTGGQILK